MHLLQMTDIKLSTLWICLCVCCLSLPCVCIVVTHENTSFVHM
jgi:hypothetical protein